MEVIDGVTGRRGNPTCLRLEDLHDFGIEGKGLLKIGTRDGRFPEWESVPGELPDPAGFSKEVLRLIAPRPGELPAGIRGDSAAIQTESGLVSREDSPGRLTGPIQFVLKLLGYWRLGTQEAVGLLGFGPADADYVTAVLDGNEHFRGRDVSDRIANLIWIRKTLWSLFRDPETENAWLREPHPLLDDRSPLSLLIGGSIEDLLLTREYVESAAGR